MMPVHAVLVDMMWGKVEHDTGSGRVKDQKKVVRWGGNIMNVTLVI